jgi:Amt family ammonium transporter
MWGIAVKNIAIFLSASAAYSVFGFRLMFGQTWHGIIGNPFRLLGLGDPTLVYVLYHTGFAAVAATIVSGAIAERTTLRTNVLIGTVVAGLIYPIHGHWVWGGGFLSVGWFDLPGRFPIGTVDFAGSGAVHYIGGIVALVGAQLCGRRADRNPLGGRLEQEQRSLAIVVIGIFFLWIGWIGFNGGGIRPEGGALDFSPVGRLVLNTCTAATFGAFAVSVVVYARYRFNLWPRLGSDGGIISPLVPFDAFATVAGAMGGMIAITASCDIASYPEGAVVVGALGGVAAYFASRVVRVGLGLDDPVDAIGVHAGSGAVGIVCAGVIKSWNVATADQSEFLGSDLALLFGLQIVWQLLDLAIAGFFAGGLSFLVFGLMKSYVVTDLRPDLAGKSPPKVGLLHRWRRKWRLWGKAVPNALIAPSEQQVTGLNFDFSRREIGILPVTGAYLSYDLQSEYRLFMAALASGPKHRLEPDALKIAEISRKLIEAIEQGETLGRLEERLRDVRALAERQTSTIELIREQATEPEDKHRVLTPVPLRLILRERVTTNRKAFPAVEFELKCERKLEGWVLGMTEMLRHAIGALIRNAAQAAEVSIGSKVQCSLHRVRVGQIGFVVVQVADNGMGIKREVITRITDPFFTTKNTESSEEPKGYGLGLFYVKYAVRSLNGHIALLHSTPDRGTLFELVFLETKSPSNEAKRRLIRKQALSIAHGGVPTWR